MTKWQQTRTVSFKFQSSSGVSVIHPKSRDIYAPYEKAMLAGLNWF